MSGADVIKKTIQSRYDESLELFNKKKYEALGTFYTENATLLPPDASPIVGRKAIVDACVTLEAPFSVLDYESTDSFELLNDRTAFATYLQAGKDDTGNKVIFYHQCILWKLVNDQWYLDREFYNVRPSPSSTEDVKKQIEGRIAALFDAFDKDDLESALDLYVENSTVVPYGKHIKRGRKAITELYRTVIPPLKKLVVDELYYFEMLNDVTVYTNLPVFSVDENDKVKVAFRDCMIWTLKNGEWFIRWHMYHEEQRTPKK